MLRLVRRNNVVSLIIKNIFELISFPTSLPATLPSFGAFSDLSESRANFSSEIYYWDGIVADIITGNVVNLLNLLFIVKGKVKKIIFIDEILL